MSGKVKGYSKYIIQTLILVLGINVSANAITYYSRISGGNWGSASTWSTVGYGIAVNTGSFPRAGDDVFIGNGHTVNINVNVVCRNITVGQGISGSINYLNVRNYTIRVSRSVIVNTGASIEYTSNAGRTNWLFIGENLTNNGNMAFYVDANDNVELAFDGSNSSTIDGTGTFNLYRVTMVKTNPLSNLMDVKIASFENATRELIVTSGYYIHNNNGNYIVNSGIPNFTITRDATIEVPSGSMHFAPTSNFVYLNGTLLITGGNVKIGRNNGAQGFRYAQVGTFIPTLKILSGSMEIYGGLTYRTVTPTSPFYFEMSAGTTLLLNSGTSGSRNGVFNIVDNPNSSFIMTGGVITLQKPSMGALVFPDFEVCVNSGFMNATDGYVEFGNASTTTCTFNFVPSLHSTLPNFKVTGPVGQNIQLKPFRNNTSNINLNSLYIDFNKTFDMNSIQTNSGGNRTLQLSGNFDGIHTFYNDGTFIGQTGTLLIQSNEGLWTGGSSPTTFYNLTVNNPFGVTINSTINIANQLTLIDGIVYVNVPNKITCQANARSNIGNNLSFIEGTFDQIIAISSPVTFNIPIGKFGNYRPVVLSVFHSNATPVTYSSEMMNTSARFFGYSLPPTLSWVSDVRYYDINRSAVSNLISAQITLSYGANDYVTDCNALRVAQYNGTSAWVNQGGVGTANISGYIISAPITSFNGRFTLANTTTGTNPLPISLLDFSAYKQDNSVELNWTTASEKNSDKFEIEKSRDNFNYKKIGIVDAAGNSNSLLSYTFNDEELTSGKIYYRLKMLDFDGSFEYSNVRYINIEKENIFSIYPNPCSADNFQIQLTKEIKSPCQFKIINLRGEIVFNGEINSSTNQISTKMLQPGAYFVLVQTPEEQETSKLIIY